MIFQLLAATVLGGGIYLPFIIIFGIRRKMSFLNIALAVIRYVTLITLYFLPLLLIGGDPHSPLKFFTLGLVLPGFILIFDLILSPFIGRSGFSLVFSFIFWGNFDRINKTKK